MKMIRDLKIGGAGVRQGPRETAHYSGLLVHGSGVLGAFGGGRGKGKPPSSIERAYYYVLGKGTHENKRACENYCVMSKVDKKVFYLGERGAGKTKPFKVQGFN